jgi:hypothetical protein
MGKTRPGDDDIVQLSFFGKHVMFMPKFGGYRINRGAYTERPANTSVF